MRLYLPIEQLARIRRWLVAHRDDHPLEYHLWDAMLTVWLLGWMGWLPALALDQDWLLPLCALATIIPPAYVGWRRAAHEHGRLRCDWLPPVD